MKIGIIGAMEQEVANLKELMQVDRTINKASMAFMSGKLNDKDVVIVRSGIGKVNAAVCTQILVDEFSVDVVINTGVAGSLRNEINIGDIVLSTDAITHDMDATGFGYELGVIPQMDNSVFVADEKLVAIAKAVCEEVNSDINVFEGRVLSGDQFISDHDKKEWLVNQFSGFCTEMEGAAIAQAAYLNNVPFLIIRAISDKADNSAEMDYSEFEAKAIEHTVKLVCGLVERI
ncbi:5'-methylthioadenosine/adenosylhomocysteine nucleosidase [Anaerosporobacter sp.]|uniref:5'-methylthioadenosine/adenosylhomocysteine nucleosidase n=1 Tax=Anaerosporobacter sp. TaxID=1872529 RepID=UPI00286F5E93|nr:5'-methylthioadenosine/adenosylhomocysteine nucleosidase [Anaerosporobacter sp.]